MCGIAGIRDFGGSTRSQGEVVGRMTSCLAHRGPDDRGVFVDEAERVALGHRRLSILDLSSQGHQPMATPGGQLWITYNGEIYNFQELKNELAKRGHTFSSDTDTEVILKAYEEWGMGMLDKFHGMFAFALWDKKTRKLTLCRDRAGVKPLYYYWRDGLLLFASELKSLHEHPAFEKKLNLQALSLFFQFGYIPAPHTIFEHTFKVLPGSYLVFDEKGGREERVYWDIRDLYATEQNHATEDDMVQELEAILKKAFAWRLVADVPLGVFLSGGIDSSTVAALLQAQVSYPLKTFTIGFTEKGYDEAPYAKRIARHLGCDHHEVYCTKEYAAEIIPKLPEMYDEPFGDSSAIPTYLVSQLARKHVKVALSADGGDELFGGYTKYDLLNRYWATRQRFPSALFSSAAFFLQMVSPEVAEQLYLLLPSSFRKYTNAKDKMYKLRNLLREQTLPDIFRQSNTFWTEEQLRLLLAFAPPSRESDMYGFDKMRGLDPVSAMQAADFRVYLPDDLLVKVDRATMAQGLEGREPFLDQDIASFIARVPSSWKVRSGKGKYILRKVLAKYVPPELFERPKQGFGIPIYAWMKQDFSRFLEEYLSASQLKKHGLFDEEAVQRILQRHAQGKGEHASKLWFLLMFQMWYSRWMQ